MQVEKVDLSMKCDGPYRRIDKRFDSGEQCNSVYATTAFISGENGGRQVENDSKKFPERIMNPQRR